METNFPKNQKEEFRWAEEKIKLIPTLPATATEWWLCYGGCSSPHKNIVLTSFWTIFWIIILSSLYITFLLNIYGKYIESWQGMWSQPFCYKCIGDNGFGLNLYITLIYHNMFAHWILITFFVKLYS